MISRNGALHHHRVGEIDEMHGHGVCLRPHRDIEDTFALDGERRRLIGGPQDGVTKQFRMVHVKHFPEGAVQIPGEINNSAVPEFAHEDPGFGLTGAR